MTQPRAGFLLTRHWRDTPQGTELSFWLATDDGPLLVTLNQAVQQYEKDFNPISHPIYATFANGSQRITAGRRIWPEDAS